MGLKNRSVFMLTGFLLLGLICGSAFAAASSTGDRIWDENHDFTYTWTPQSYSGFYYDLDSDGGSENMTISLKANSRSVDEGNLTYSTEPIEVEFEYGDWGSYQIIGFMAEKYFAGYTKENATFADETISMMSSGQLAKVLIDEKEKRSIFSGSSLVFEEGYSLDVIEVDVNGDRVFVSLKKDGREIDEDIISSGGEYVYEKDLGDAEDVPIIIVHFNEVFRGTETNAVFVEGVFQISDDYLNVESGDKFGKMEVTDVGASRIEMVNDDSFSLSEGDTIDVMGKIKFIVADDDDLRFAPFVDMSEPGKYELRGTVAENKAMEWDPLNFEGFYYDIDEGIKTESLKIDNGEISKTDSKIESGSLVYSTKPAKVSFEHDQWGEFQVIGFLTEKYFAGYTKDNTTFADESISMLSRGQLAKVLIDDDEKQSVFSGSPLVLEGGYSLNIVEVDVNGNSVFVVLTKDGDEIDSEIVSTDEDYVYESDLGDVEDVPIIAVNFDEVFKGSETNAVFVEGIFQISDEYVELESGDTYDKMEVTVIDSTGIEMENDDSISLEKGEVAEIMEGIKFKVADDSDVRFYPFIEINTNPLESMDISIPLSVEQGDYVEITVTSKGSGVDDASISIEGSFVGTTGNDGSISYRASNDGKLTIEAEKDGFTSASAELEVIDPFDDEKKTLIEVSPDVVYEGDKITISVLTAIGGDPIEDAFVSFDGNSIGTTSSAGTIKYTTEQPGVYRIESEMAGFLGSEIDLEVLELKPEFEFSNIVVEPMEVKSGENVTICVNVTNAGTAEGEHNVELLVNGTVAGSRMINLGIGEMATVEFNHIEEVPGIYPVGIGTQVSTYEVTKTLPAPGILVSLIILLSVAFVMRRSREL